MTQKKKKKKHASYIMMVENQGECVNLCKMKDFVEWAILKRLH